MLYQDKYTIQHKRVYVAIQIRAGNYGQAEMSVKEFQFSEKGKDSHQFFYEINCFSSSLYHLLL